MVVAGSTKILSAMTININMNRRHSIIYSDYIQRIGGDYYRNRHKKTTNDIQLYILQNGNLQSAIC
jgi:hypothetical protein